MAVRPPRAETDPVASPAVQAEQARAEAAEALAQPAGTAATDAELAGEAAARDAAIAAHADVRREVHGIPATVNSGDALVGDGSGGFTTTTVSAKPGTTDTVNGRVLVTPTADTENAIVVKSPDAGWGVAQPYGTGQAFMLLKPAADPTDIGYAGTTPDDLVIFRVNGGDGSLGTGGNFHLATGLRQPAGYGGGADTGWGCLYVNPYVDVAPISIKPQVALTKPYIRGYATDGTTLKFALDQNGQLQLPTQGTTGGIVLGGDTPLYRSGTKALTLGGALFVQGLQVQPSPAANQLSIFFSGSASNYSGLQVGRTAAESQIVVSNAADFLFTGVAAGDTLIRQIAGKLHIGVASGAAEIRVGDSQLGFYGTAPVAKPTVTGAKGSNAALASLLTALASMGLLTDSSTA